MGKTFFNGSLGPRPNTYDLARMFAAAADEARAGYVSCPACGGSGRRKGIDKGHYRADLDSEICSGCRGAGDVAERRVCGDCREFRSCCVCKPSK
jgi:hypothetical protein